MLSRTAANLYWIGRYMERAETQARLLEVGERISLLPSLGDGFRSEWDSILAATGGTAAFQQKYDQPVQRNLESWMFFDKSNPSSVASCLEQARENARIVRTALTGQVWDALNTAFQELRALEREARSDLPLTRLTEWTTTKAALIKGAIENTQLRNDGYRFLSLGAHLERADNTARLLDVKYYVLLPTVDYVGSGFDNGQWSTLLRALSAHRAFNFAYGGEVNAGKIVDFLVLNPVFPRSLRWCVDTAMGDLEALARGYGRSTPAQDAIRRIAGEIDEMQVTDIFTEGMHEFLGRMIGAVAEVDGAIGQIYFSGDMT